MLDLDTSLPAALPPLPAGEQVPWIATWNYSETRLSEAMGPLGWPYPLIEPLDVTHGLTTDGFADAEDCCENLNHFANVNVGGPQREIVGYQLCMDNPAMLCEVVPECDGEQ
jgi:hypothetical protein